MAEVNSTIWNAQTGSEPVQRAAAREVDAKVRFVEFSYTHSGAESTGPINLVKLPAGKLSIDPRLSYLNCDTATLNASGTLSLGTAAYVNSNGNSVSANVDALHNATNANVAINSVLSPDGGPNALVRVDSVGGVAVQAVLSSAIQSGKTVFGRLYYVRGQ